MGVCTSRSGRGDSDGAVQPVLILQSSLTNADSTHVNRLLNTLHSNEVETLTQIFKFHCRECADPLSSIRSYTSALSNVLSLKTLFPDLQNELFTDQHVMNIFHAFDNTNKAYIDLRDFCRLYVIATRGSKAEMTELLYTIFADRTRKLEKDRLTSRINTDSTLANKRSLNVRQTHPIVVSVPDADKEPPPNNPEDVSTPQDSLLDLSLSVDGLDCLLRLCFGKKLIKINRLKEAGIPNCPMSFHDFADFASRYIEDSEVETALQLFDVLPKVHEERSICLKALEEGQYSLVPGQLIYAVHEKWWLKWCQHIGIVTDNSALVVDSSDRSLSSDMATVYLILSVKPQPNPQGSHIKPGEIDNSSLQDVYDLASFSSLVLAPDCHDRFVFITGPLWFALTGIYGGGPEFPRRLREMTDASSFYSLKPSLSDERVSINYNDDINMRIDERQARLVDVDLRPLVLQGLWCAASGHPCSFRQKALVSRGGDARELIKWALADIGVYDRGAARDAQHPIGVNDINLWILRDALRIPSLKPRTNMRSPSIESTASVDASQSRPIKSLSMDSEAQDRLNDAWTEDENAPKKYSGGTSFKWLRHGADTYWQLVEGDQRRVALESLGVTSRFIVMFESRCVTDSDKSPNAKATAESAHIWPTDRAQEPAAFRDFRLWEWVDVLSYRGKWCLAQIVKVFTAEDNRIIDVKGGHTVENKANKAEVEPTIGGVKKKREKIVYLRLRFYKATAKSDEDVEFTSHRIAPPGSRTFRMMDEDGVNTTPCVLPVLLLTEVLRKKYEYFTTINSQRQALLSFTPEHSGAGVSSGHIDIDTSSILAANAGSSLIRSESHLVVRRRASFVHHQSSVLRRLHSALMLAVQILEPEVIPHSDSAASADTPPIATTQTSLQSTLSMPYNAIKTFVNSTKSSESYHLAENKNSVNFNELITGDGCVGLANLGNTCYMCAALQCLSHTPLLRHFFISGRFQSELSRSNPLGTGGLVAQEYAFLMKLLWSSKGHVVPSRFKKSFGMTKVQFSGNEQNDAQEFLAELLDMLHEDLNRVEVKVYVEALSDERMERMTFTQQAEEAWNRHLARNRSMLVDLFQGQLCSKISCPCCSKVSRTFDPFMFLSVPLLAKQHECKVFVTVVRRMRVMRLGNTARIDEDILLDSYTNCRNPVRYCVSLPRLGDVNDLKVALSKVSGVPPQHMRAVVAKGRRILRTLHDVDSLLEIAEFGGSKCIVFEAVKDIPYLAKLPISRFSNRWATRKGDTTPDTDNVPSEGYSEKSDYDLGHLPWEGDVIVDIGSRYDGGKIAYWEQGVNVEEESALFWPKTIAEFTEGIRVDAVDMKGDWFPGSINEIRVFAPKDVGRLLHPSTHYARVHLDNCSSLWDDWISEEDLINQRIKRVYTHSVREVKLIELVVIHRKATKDDSRGRKVELFGLPSLIHIESIRSCKHALRIIAEQSTRYMSKYELMKYIESEAKRGTADEDSCFDLPFKVRMLSTLRPFVPGKEFQDALEIEEVRSKKVPPQQEAVNQQDWEGDLFPSSAEIPLGNVYHPKLILAIDWNDVEDAKGESNRSRDVAYVDHNSYVSAMLDLNNMESAMNGNSSNGASEPYSSFVNFGSNDSVNLYDCLKAFTNTEVLDEDTWYCGECKTHRRGQMQTSIYRLPDILVIHVKRFSMTAKRREKIRTKVDFPLVSLNMSAYMSSEGSDSTGGTMYDLYGVANHIGDMTRGHYTAFVNCQVDSMGDLKGQPSSDRLDAEQTYDLPSSRGRWFLFDDDLVEEVPANRIVSPSAYVLFYKRRKLTPSNIINLTA